MFQYVYQYLDIHLHQNLFKSTKINMNAANKRKLILNNFSKKNNQFLKLIQMIHIRNIQLMINKYL